jgi:hypothetical protein
VEECIRFALCSRNLASGQNRVSSRRSRSGSTFRGEDTETKIQVPAKATGFSLLEGGATVRFVEPSQGATRIREILNKIRLFFSL